MPKILASADFGRISEDGFPMYAERDIERLNLALRLLDIIKEDGCCERVGKPFNFVKSKNNDNLYELEDDPESYYTIL